MMIRYGAKLTTGIGAGLALAVSAHAAPAQRGTEWVVSEASGGVSVIHQGLTLVAARGSRLSPGDSVVTAANARAVVVHGEEFAVVAPLSRLEIAPVAQAGGMTRLIQTIGNAVFTLRQKLVPYFEVQTPYLAAVVKGTTFSVTVDRAGASVQVIEGAVDVATAAGGTHHLVLPGDIAVVRAGAAQTLTITGTHTASLAPVSPGGAGAGQATATTQTTAGSSTTAAAAPASGTTGTTVSATVQAPSASASAAASPAAASSTVAATQDHPVSLAAVTQGLVTDGAATAAATPATTASTGSTSATRSASSVHAATPSSASTPGAGSETEGTDTATQQSSAATAISQTRKSQSGSAKGSGASDSGKTSGSGGSSGNGDSGKTSGGSGSSGHGDNGKTSGSSGASGHGDSGKTSGKGSNGKDGSNPFKGNSAGKTGTKAPTNPATALANGHRGG